MSLRKTLDINLQQVVNLPAAGASASTPSVDLGTGPHLERLEAQVTIPDAEGLEDDKDLTVTFEDSEDGENFTAIAELSEITLTGAGGNGAAGVTRAVRLPSSFRGHLRATAALEAAGGDVTDVILTLDILQ